MFKFCLPYLQSYKSFCLPSSISPYLQHIILYNANPSRTDTCLTDSRPRLSPSTEVLYRNNAKHRSSSSTASFEGEGILCRVTSVIGEGKQRRYEIIDADPDPPTPSMPYRASVNHLIPIPPPSSNTTLPDLNKGRNVLALYPGTTTFYKAEVVAGWKVSDWKREGSAGEKEVVENTVRLRFEGEDEADREMSVERRYVLPDR